MKNLVIILDGLGYDQLIYFSPPHLTDLGKQLGIIPLNTLLAYSSGIYTALYTGLYPDENDFWTEFIRRDEPLSPWTSLFRLAPGKSLPRKLSYVASRLVHIFDRNAQDNFVPPFLQNRFGRIPVHYDRLPPIEIQSPTLISALFEQAEKSLKYIHCEELNSEVVSKCVDIASTSHTIILCVAETDHAGHAFGPMSQAFGTALVSIDDRLNKMLAALQSVTPDFRIFIFSDHGMTPITRQFDAWSYLEDNGFYLDKDYVAFINSTVMSLWFEKNNREQINDCLNKSGYGRILTKQEKQKYRLNFRGRQYGDDFFIVDEGVEFIPNFLNLAWKHGMGMHGYSPEYSSTRAFLIGSGKLGFVPEDVVSLYKMLTDMALF